MAVTVEGTPTQSLDFNASSITWSYTAGGDGLFVGGANDNDDVFTSCTFNGDAMEELWDQNDTGANASRSAGYLMCAPDAGAHNVVLTCDSMVGMLWGGAVGLSGLASPVASAHRTVYKTGGGLSVTVADAESGDLVIDSAVTYNNTIAAGAGQTSQVEDDSIGGTTYSAGISTEEATGSTVMSWTGGTYSCMGATALIAAGGGPTTRNTRSWPLGERAGMGFRIQR